MKQKIKNRATPSRTSPTEAGAVPAAAEARPARASGRGRAAPLQSKGRRRARSVRVAEQALQKSPPAAPPSKIILRLFVAGTTARSRQAILRARELCKGEPHDTCELEVIDIYQQPKLAHDHQIVATPTLIKEFPRPVRRFIGNLLNTSGLYLELNLVRKGNVIL